MKGIVTLILAIVITVGSANMVSAQCCQPVRNAVKRVVCVPVKVVRKVQEKKPVRSFVKKVDAARPVRKVLKRCLGCCGCCCGC